MTQDLRPDGHVAAPSASPSYSAAVRKGELILTSGQLGADPHGAPVTFREQAELALERLLESVAALGGSAGTLLKVTAYLAEMDDWPVWDEVWRERLQLDPMPARTTVQVGAFIPPLLIELDCVAYAAGPG
ncbi:RidA family protein [Conexibacter woesei]|uniref:Endoribonuclease L-PSP n=1 Tax=Conexibacter woesei (strain DSM 14684 / CCUG 47730 / CIP 108061 / JCM 11494 / NBRC 100937 / ID131577) TaxID=469383 RepID=D3F5H5_CONWI|nr:RidA family protein [Conexibacter woesei]ADB50642.1 Endoribonuclease L-PSP [Conexibacter woesei DSM 14684]